MDNILYIINVDIYDKHYKIQIPTQIIEILDIYLKDFFKSKKSVKS